MNTYKYRVILDVEIEAFDDSDALDALYDQFSVGEQQGVNITECEVKLRRGNRKQ
jgi:hypothetical protein